MHIFLNNCLLLKITKDDNKKKNNTYKLEMASSKLKRRDIWLIKYVKMQYK